MVGMIKEGYLCFLISSVKFFHSEVLVRVDLLFGLLWGLVVCAFVFIRRGTVGVGEKICSKWC